jgi:hypothetical protein
VASHARTQPLSEPITNHRDTGSRRQAVLTITNGNDATKDTTIDRGLGHAGNLTATEA